MLRSCVVATVVAAAALTGCGDRDPVATETAPATPATPVEEPHPHDRELQALYALEERRRGETDFATLPPSEAVLGPDPYRVASLRGGTRVGILRGDSAVVAIDGDGAELARLPAPRSPSGLAVSADDDVLVVGDGARGIAQFRPDAAGHLARVATLPVDALGMRDIALAPDGKTAYVVEERDGRLLAIALDRDDPARALHVAGARELGRCHGPIRVAAVVGYVVIDCLLDHTLEIRRDGTAEVVRIHHDGPIWSFAVRREPDGGLLVAAGGVEDHPLVREDGGFGFIDSFVFVYRLAAGGTQPAKLAEINASELGAVTPKWIAFGGPLAVVTAGYAGSTVLTLTWPDRTFAAAPVVTQAAVPPGIAAAELAADGTLVAADPLLDAWIVKPIEKDTRIASVPSPRAVRSMRSRVGEALFFTSMMAPWNSTEGKLSRFTCETCHFEGYVDGRIHYTGRDDVHATTRPLYGLFNDRPYFSRALDQTMTQMVHSEFKVANRHSGHDPWFALERGDRPWLARLGAPEHLPPELLREAFMSFLMDFSHRANPAVIDRVHFDDTERAGAVVFRDRCAGCHAARLIGEDPASEVPFERWEALVMSPPGPIVWSNTAYGKTGVLPYVGDRGTRVPSLRRLYKKWPYFTNGDGKSLAGVLDAFGWDDHAAFHEGAPAAASRLTAADKATLVAFLDLL